ncbi:CST complex subunit TEN1 [Paramormyrops kingsleyae]|uniref:CST complex subunit TEN1 n=1 Tax=Paramormyrops kingsleyae TaxID=1676925 RepID=UPI000CD61470|nr:CST complex subunit TEN1 [Paramormyrops kingsleyae]
MLPEPGVFHFPWEISSVQEGAAVRTYGRLLSYQPEVSEAVLSSQHLSVQYDITVHTAFVEPFLPSLHSHYIVLGDVERTEGDGVMVRARVLNCVDGINLALLQQAIVEQRRYLQERDGEAPVQPTAQ